VFNRDRAGTTRIDGSKMATTLVYEIARFGVRTDAEVLTEHAQVISRDGALWHLHSSEIERMQLVEACGDCAM
jgi:hypothetical protein